MDLEALLLTTGPNASNTSAGRDNLTSAGEWGRRGATLLCAGEGKGGGITPEPNCLGNFQGFISGSAGCLARRGRGEGGGAGKGRRSWSKGTFRSGKDGGQRRRGLAAEFQICSAGKIPGWESQQEMLEDSLWGGNWRLPDSPIPLALYSNCSNGI